MKITKEHFEHIKSAIETVFKINGGKEKIVEMYETGNFRNAENVKDLQKRFNFDMLYAAGLTNFVCDELYSYLNDDHIATALKKICPPVTKRYY